jgi:hypothetical protein
VTNNDHHWLRGRDRYGDEDRQKENESFHGDKLAESLLFVLERSVHWLSTLNFFDITIVLLKLG